MDADLLDTLVSRLDADDRRDGRYHADCPFCGKEVKRGQKHFSFVAEGYKCWVCGAAGGLRALAEHLDLSPALPVRSRPAPKPAEPKAWQTDNRVLERYTGALDTLTRWQAYKPLSIETIARARLGVGVLPASRCKRRRLILPVFDGNTLVALHGRAFLQDDDDAKWLTAGGSRKDVLYGVQWLTRGCQAIICENLVDALLVTDRAPGVVGLAGGGVNWRDEWTQQIAAIHPTHVLVWLDNDLVGCPNPITYATLKRQWLTEHPNNTPPEPRGPQIANDLLAAGVKASIYRWPAGTPAKYDIGSALMAEMRSAA